LNNIRVTYSGLIAFAVSMTSVLTGITFTLIVTRKLSVEEFGIWSIVGSMTTYFMIVEPIVSFWSTRQIARGEEVGKTSLISSVIFSFCSVPIYLVLAYFVSFVNRSYFDTMILGVVLIPVSFISQTLTALNLGFKPQSASYGILAFEFLKIPAGLALVYFLNLGVNGAIIAVLVGYLGKIGILVFFGKEKLKGQFKKEIFQWWIKLSWLPLYSRINKLLGLVDVVIYTAITGSIVGAAYFSAAFTMANIISYATAISQGLIPKLLAKGSYDHVRETITRLMFFTIPLLGISIIFAKPALFALNPAYSNASVLVIMLGFKTFFYVLSSTFNDILVSIETIDIEKNPKYSVYIKSKLFLIPTINNIQYGIYIVVMIIVLFILNSTHQSQIELVKWWIFSGLITTIPFLIISWFLLQKHVKLSFPYISTIKYGIGTTASGLAFHMTSNFFINYHRSIYDFLPGVIFEAVIFLGIYLFTTYMLDEKTRLLLKAITTEFTNRN